MFMVAKEQEDCIVEAMEVSILEVMVRLKTLLETLPESIWDDLAELGATLCNIGAFIKGIDPSWKPENPDWYHRKLCIVEEIMGVGYSACDILDELPKALPRIRQVIRKLNNDLLTIVSVPSRRDHRRGRLPKHSRELLTLFTRFHNADFFESLSGSIAYYAFFIPVKIFRLDSMKATDTYANKLKEDFDDYIRYERESRAKKLQNNPNLP